MKNIARRIIKALLEWEIKKFHLVHNNFRHYWENDTTGKMSVTLLHSVWSGEQDLSLINEKEICSLTSRNPRCYPKLPSGCYRWGRKRLETSIRRWLNIWAAHVRLWMQKQGLYGDKSLRRASTCNSPAKSSLSKYPSLGNTTVNW